jgi:hypothetical protein
MPGQQTADDRLKGVKEVLAKNPGIQVISQTGKWTLDEGRNVTENTLQRWPDLNSILCTAATLRRAVKATRKARSPSLDGRLSGAGGRGERGRSTTLSLRPRRIRLLERRGRHPRLDHEKVPADLHARS